MKYTNCTGCEFDDDCPCNRHLNSTACKNLRSQQENFDDDWKNDIPKDGLSGITFSVSE